MRSAPSSSPSHISGEATPLHGIKGQTSHTWCHHTHVSRKEINTKSPHCNICKRKADNLCLSLRLLPVDHQRQSRSQLLRSSQRDGSLTLYLIHRLDMLLRCPWLTPSYVWKNCCLFSAWLTVGCMQSTKVHALQFLTLFPEVKSLSNPVFYISQSCDPLKLVRSSVGISLMSHYHRSFPSLCPSSPCPAKTPQSWIPFSVWAELSQGPVLPLPIPLTLNNNCSHKHLTLAVSLALAIFIFPGPVFSEDHHPLLCLPRVGAWQLGLSVAGDRMACGAL